MYEVAGLFMAIKKFWLIGGYYSLYVNLVCTLFYYCEFLQRISFFKTFTVDLCTFSVSVKKFSGFFLIAVDLPVSDAFAVSGLIVYKAANIFGRETQEASHFVRKVR